MLPAPRPSRCRTCGVAIELRPYVDEEARLIVPAPYCSIHCEHYDGLARASRRGAVDADA